MRTLAILILLVILSVSTMFAQVNGRVLDADTAGVLAYATVVVLKPNSNEVSTFAYTDADGKFTLSLPKEQLELKIRVQYVGYQTLEKYYRLDKSQELKISLKRNSEELSEIVLTSKQNAVVSKGDKLIFNVEQLGINQGNNGLETLQQLPGIRLDKDENVLFRGSAGVAILINGKRSLLQGDALREFIRALSGNDIQAVEIIAQPSARYEASGTTGIINIILKKSYSQQFNGALYVRGGYGEYFKQKYGARLFYNDSVWSISANGYYYNGSSVNYRTIKQTIQLEDTERIIDQSNEWLPITESKSFGFGVERRLNEHQLISTEWQLYHRVEDATTYGDTKEMTNSIKTNEVNLLQNGLTDSNTITGNLFYNFTSDSAVTKVDMQLNYAYYRKNLSGIQENTYENGNIMRLLGNNHSNYNVINTQLDVTQKLSESTTLEIGGKYATVHMKYHNEYQTNNQELLFIPDSLLINDFEYTEDLLGAYTQFSFNVGEWNFLGGLRLESYKYKALSKINNELNSNSFTNWFPSFSANYKNKDSQYRLAYSRRIGRPNYLSLNPYYQYMDAYSLKIGNPNLRPRLYHSFELGYIYKNALNISLYGYTYKNDFTQVIDYIEGENYNVTYEANAGRGNNFGLSLSLPHELNNWWSLQLEADVAIFHESATIPEYSYNGDGFGWYSSVYQRFDLSKNWVVNWNGYYASRSAMPTGIQRAHYDFSFSVKKQLLEDKIMLVGGCLNVLRKNLFSKVYDVNNVRTDWTNKWETRRFYLQLTYNFGKGKVKKIKQSSLQEERNRM